MHFSLKSFIEKIEAYLAHTDKKNIKYNFFETNRYSVDIDSDSENHLKITSCFFW